MKSEVSMSTQERHWVVQKYGGTCIGKFPEEITEIICNELERNRLAVVCSARSSGLKADGTTTKLLKAAAEAAKGNSLAYSSIVTRVRDDHVQAATSTLRSPDLLASLTIEIERETDDLMKYLTAADTLGEVSPRTLDIIISKGEILSCYFITALLQNRGIDAYVVDLSNIRTVEAPTGDVNQGFYEDYAEALRPVFLESGKRVPVVTGFFGPVPGGLLSHVGRGYTDLCAALVAISLGASELQILKEVEGIFSADPRKVPTARLLATITPSEAAELTFYGSEVIHPFTMEQVIRASIPIRIRNVTNPRGTGTTILPDPSNISASSKYNLPNLPTPTFRSRKSVINNLPLSRVKRPTAVTVKNRILVINVRSNKRTSSRGFLERTFAILDKWRLSVDLIASSEVSVSMAFYCHRELVRGDDDQGRRIVDPDLRGGVDELARLGAVELVDEMAIVSLVGQEMKHMVGISGAMLSVLGKHDINIEMISQGASEINISCVVDQRDADRAMSIIHTNLFTFLE
ncbi:putative aspartate kinase [Usnea florida]